MDDLLGLYGATSKPSVTTVAAPAASASSHVGDPFDTYWEQLGGSANASHAAPKILSPPRKPAMPMAHAIGNPGLASFASMGFIPGPSRRGPAPTAPGGKPATASAAAEVSLADFDVKPSGGAAGLGITPVEEAGEDEEEMGMHHHDEEEGDEHDEEIDEPGVGEFDLLGFGTHGTYTGARARRRSSVTVAGAAAAAAAAGAASSGTGSRRGSVSGSSSTSAAPIAASTAVASGAGRRGSVGGAAGLPPVAPSSGAAALAVAAASGDAGAAASAAGPGRRPSLTLHLDGVGGGPGAAPAAAAERPKDADHTEGVIWLRGESAKAPGRP